MRRGEMLSRRATIAVGLTAAVSLVLVIRLRLSAPDGVAGIGLYAFFARGALVGSSLMLCASWAHARGYRALDRFGYAMLVGSRAPSDGVLPDRAGPPGATWNGSRWVAEERVPMSAMFGGGVGYQGAESAEETRRREARERAEREHWARVEREDEAREEERRRLKREEKNRREKKERRREREDEARAARDREKASSESRESRADAKWADFEQRWAALEAESSTTSSSLTYDDVPWPPKMTELLRRAAKGSKKDTREFKAAYRALLLRWHPDKFAARHGSRLLEDDREKVLARVNAVARALNVAFAEG